MPAEERLPERVVVRLRIERARRGGKTVTVLYGLPRNRAFLSELAAELRRACGTGGTATDDGLELQGDQREAVRRLLAARNWTVKG